ncbi:DUF554 domain-containing protein [Nocardioides sp. Leaf374]|uniref:DUF554 domain-containing protein n=1 Tax=Nocardioides sp. Leaf374 TaxID=2876560 RepID=UPI001E472C3C|nr:DUF554 domain-containing protein [Nocardioides sp. Leaf374]
MIPGAGTLVNVATVLVGSGLGVLLGNRLPTRTRELVTDALGLVTLLIAATSAMEVLSPDLSDAVGSSAPMLVVLGAMLVGGIVGSTLRLEQRVEQLGAWLQRRLGGGSGPGDAAPDAAVPDAAAPDAAGPGAAAGERRRRFVEGFVVASLVFCTGPLTILGSLNDGLGNGADQLYLKSTLDFFAAIAFAASFGWGVAASVLTVVTVQGGLTLVGLALGDVLPDAQLAAITATGGLLLVGVALRLLRIREVAVADLLPALLVAPLLVTALAAYR